jgi:hypothetical protein
MKGQQGIAEALQIISHRDCPEVMSVDRGINLSTYKRILTFYQEEFADVIIEKFKNCAEICEANISLMYSEILRLNISVYMISHMNLSNAVKHLH